MSFISVFDVLGPNMIGPSSSHTAGAAVIAQLAQKLIAPPLKKVEFTLYGHITKVLSDRGVNLAFMRLFRESKGLTAYSIIESDGRLPEGITEELKKNPYIHDVMIVQS